MLEIVQIQKLNFPVFWRIEGVLQLCSTYGRAATGRKTEYGMKFVRRWVQKISRLQVLHWCFILKYFQLLCLNWFFINYASSVSQLLKNSVKFSRSWKAAFTPLLGSFTTKNKNRQQTLVVPGIRSTCNRKTSFINNCAWYIWAFSSSS
jgi:hypothetical protein